MSIVEEEINLLKKKISELENENRLLKERLSEAGISYADIINAEVVCKSEKYDPNQGARINKINLTEYNANNFFIMFCRGRKDAYDLRYCNPKNGKTGYYLQCHNRWDPNCHRKKKDKIRCKDCEMKAYMSLDMKIILKHMSGNDPYGNDVVAIFPMLENNTCQLLVFDFDNHKEGAEQNDFANVDDDWKDEVNALRQICINLGIDAAVERSRSGKGAHLWIFFKDMVPARLARRFGYALLEKGAESVNLKSFR